MLSTPEKEENDINWLLITIYILYGIFTGLYHRLSVVGPTKYSMDFFFRGKTNLISLKERKKEQKFKHLCLKYTKMVVEETSNSIYLLYIYLMVYTDTLYYYTSNWLSQALQLQYNLIVYVTVCVCFCSTYECHTAPNIASSKKEPINFLLIGLLKRQFCFSFLLLLLTL